MKIFIVETDVNKYQSLFLADEDRDLELSDCADCVPKLPGWNPPDVYIDSPLLEPGHFIELWACGAFAMRPDAVDKLSALIAPSGEFLQLPVAGITYTVLNVLFRANCIDQNNLKRYNNKDRNSGITQYAFIPRLVPHVSIFKIPETISEIYAVERTGDPKTEFKAAVEHHGLTGLIFKQIWEG